MSGEVRASVAAIAAEYGWVATVFSRTDQFRHGPTVVELSWSGNVLSAAQLKTQSGGITASCSAGSAPELVSIAQSWLADADPHS